MHRFFVDPGSIAAGRVKIAGPAAHQIERVLRLRPGERVGVLDDSGWEHEVELESVGTRVNGRVVGKSLPPTEPAVKITLYQGLVRGPRFDTILQKCSELGVVAIVPTICERSVVGHVEDGRDGKLERWQRIATEAAEQSGRARRPIVQPVMLLRQAFERARLPAFIPWEEARGGGERERAIGLRDATRRAATGTGQAGRPGAASMSVGIFIGPEGGFTAEEIEIACGYGVETVALGPRLLRSETAAIVACAIVLGEYGDLG